jgi:hypothetical protein
MFTFDYQDKNGAATPASDPKRGTGLFCGDSFVPFGSLCGFCRIVFHGDFAGATGTAM